jgi:uncharacterized membrane protein (DUF106 family)
MRFLRIIFIVIIIIFFAIIYTQNLDVFTHTFELKLDLDTYFLGPYITKNIVLILGAFVVGAFVALVFGALQSMTASSEAKRKIKDLQAQVKELQSHIKELTSEDPAVVEEEQKDGSPFSSPS